MDGVNRTKADRKGMFRTNGAALRWGVLLLAAGTGVRSPELFAREHPIPGSRFETVRGAAVSDALFAFVDDGTALLYNPAGLGKVRGNRIEPLHAQIHGNFGYFSMLDRNFLSKGSLSAWTPLLAAKPGTQTSAGYSVFPNFVFKGIGIGLLYQNSVIARSSEDGQSVSYSSRNELVPTLGFSLRFASGVARLGYSLQWVNAGIGSGSVPVGSAATASYREGLSAGSGFSHNAALALTIPASYLPSLNIVARNIGGLRYTSSSTLLPLANNSTSVPGDESMSFDVGLSLEPKLGAGATGSLAFTYRDVTRTSSSDLLTRFAMGGEYVFRQLFAFRAGYSAGFATFGAAILSRRGELSLAWYNQFTGTEIPGPGERRLALGYSLRVL